MVARGCDSSSTASPLRQDVEEITFSGDGDPEVTGTAELDDEGRVTSMEVSGLQRPADEEREAFDLEDDEEGVRIELRAAIEEIDEPVEVEAPDDGVVDVADAPGVAELLELEAG